MNEMTSSLVVMVVFIAAMYFLLIRPQKKKDKQIQAMRNNLQVGDEIITIGGIRGKIVKTKDESLVIQVGADKVKFEIMRWAVSKVVEEGKRSKATSEEEAPKKMPKRIKKAAVEEVVAEETPVVEETVVEEAVEETAEEK